MYKKITFSLILLISVNCFSQNIVIGQDAQDVKKIVELSTAKNQKENRFKKRNVSERKYESKYNNGELEEVIQCYENQYLIDFKIKADYCERYVMENGKLHHTIKEFGNINLNQLEQFYISNSYAKYKIENFYFSDDFKLYYKFYLSKSNLASVEMQKVIISNLSKDLQSKIRTKKQLLEKTKSDDAIKNILGQDGTLNESKIKNDTLLSIIDSIENKDINLKKDNKLIGRKCLIKPMPNHICNENGVVVIQISVDKSGKVINVKVIANGTTNNAKCLLDEAKIAAMNTRWEPKEDVPDIQIGKIIYTFKSN